MEVDDYLEMILKELKELIENVLENRIIDNEFVTELENRAKQVRNWYMDKLKEHEEEIKDFFGV